MKPLVSGFFPRSEHFQGLATWFRASVLLTARVSPRVCLAVDTDRFVLKPSQRSFPALAGPGRWGVLRPGGRQGRVVQAAERTLASIWPQRVGSERRGPAGGKPHTSADHPLSQTSPPRTLTGAEWEGLSRGLANLENLFAWQRSCGLGWGIKVISKSFHR